MVEVLEEALRKYIERDGVYQGAWKEAGWEDSLDHIRSKAKRLLRWSGTEPLTIQQQAIEDDAIDLINYTAFFLLNLRADRRGDPGDL